MNKLHIITLKIKDVEKKFNIKVKQNVQSLGLDTAGNTGWSLIKTDDKNLYISVGFLNINVKAIKDKDKRKSFLYNTVFDLLKNIIKKEYLVVIEEVFYSRNVRTVITLSRIGAIAFTLARLCGCKKENIIWKSAVQARKALGLKCNVKKEIVQKEFNEKLGCFLSNSDEIDAIILALCGVIL